MGINERKEREKELKRVSILEAAEALILEKGLDYLNMDEVAEQAEVSKGSLYVYFANKTDLVLGICHKASCMIREKISKVLTEDKSGLEMVYQVGILYMKFATEHPEYYRAMRFLETYKDSDNAKQSDYVPVCVQNREESFRVMVRAIQIGMQDGSIRTNYNAEELAVLLWATSHGVVNIAYIEQNSEHYNLANHLGITLKQMFDGYMTLIGSGIATKPDKVIDSESFFETVEVKNRNGSPN
jgi:AcrR family transcriptional regulator